MVGSMNVSCWILAIQGMGYLDSKLEFGFAAIAKHDGKSSVHFRVPVRSIVEL